MQLYQLLRYIHLGTPIVIFDIQGIEIIKVRDKTLLPIDLYEYTLLDMCLGYFDENNSKIGLYITIEK